MKTEELKNSLFGFIGRVHDKGDMFVHEELKKRGISGLVYSHISIIVVLSIYKKLSMKEISEKISKDKSTVTILVNKLESLGYVRKQSCKRDKRVVYIVLEKKADDIIEAVLEVSQSFGKRIEQVLKEDEIANLFLIMEKLVNNF